MQMDLEKKKKTLSLFLTYWQLYFHFTEIDCPPLDPPVNGALDQSYVQNTLITTMLCNEQFDIPVVSSGFTGQFICLNTGTWNPNIEVPDCIGKQHGVFT